MPESELESSCALTVLPADKPLRTCRAIAAEIVLPAIISDTGARAARCFLDFLSATIRNKNTRTAYLYAASRFFARYQPP